MCSLTVACTVRTVRRSGEHSCCGRVRLPVPHRTDGSEALTQSVTEGNRERAQGDAVVVRYLVQHTARKGTAVHGSALLNTKQQV